MFWTGLMTSSLTMLCLVGSFVQRKAGNDQRANSLDEQTALWFIAACICFK